MLSINGIISNADLIFWSSRHIKLVHHPHLLVLPDLESFVLRRLSDLCSELRQGLYPFVPMQVVEEAERVPAYSFRSHHSVSGTLELFVGQHLLASVAMQNKDIAFVK